MPLIAYLPWLVLPEPTSVGDVTFHPWRGTTADGLTGDGLESLPLELGLIAGMYRECDGRLVREGVLVGIHDGRPEPFHLREDDSDNERVIEAVHLLFMACLVEQQRGTSFRPEYINGSALELYFQRYTVGTTSCAPVSKRMGQHEMGHVDMREAHFSRPPYAGHQGKPDTQYLKALAASSTDTRTTIYEAAKLLMVGLSDATYLTESVEVALVTMALERLVGEGRRNTFANLVTEWLTHPLASRTDKVRESRRPAMFAEDGVVAVLAKAKAEQQRKKAKDNVLSEEPSVILHWAADLYMARNAATHGGEAECQPAWTLNEHKYYGMVAACLISLLMLHRDGGYELTTTDVGQWHSFSHRLLLTPGQTVGKDRRRAHELLSQCFESAEQMKRTIELMKQEWASQEGEGGG